MWCAGEGEVEVPSAAVMGLMVLVTSQSGPFRGLDRCDGRGAVPP
jgi:hypothetical protein